MSETDIYTITLNPAVDRQLLVSAIEPDTVLRAIGSQVDFGGKGFNVSRMLMSLGAKSTAMGFVGGKSGEMLEEGLNSLNIDTDFVWIKGETRTNISIVVPEHNHYIKVNEPGPYIPIHSVQQLMEKVQSLLKPGDFWVLAGSLPPGVLDTFYADLVQVIEAKGAHAILDTSGQALESGCKAGAYFVKPNSHEVESLTGIRIETEQDVVNAGKLILRMGVKNVIISLGEKGAVLVQESGSWFIKSPKIQEINPIGAGDSLVGGVVWGLSRGLSMPQAIRWGVACGAATASTEGTAMGSRSLVEELLNQVESQKID